MHVWRLLLLARITLSGMIRIMDVEIIGPAGSAAASLDHWTQGHMWGGTITPRGDPPWWPRAGDTVTVRTGGGTEADALVGSDGPGGPPALTIAGMGAPTAGLLDD